MKKGEYYINTRTGEKSIVIENDNKTFSMPDIKDNENGDLLELITEEEYSK